MDIAPTNPSNPFLDQLIDFLTSEPNTDQIIAFQPSEALKRRSNELLERNRQTLLTAQERIELDEFLRMNHFVNMLKIRARQRLAQV